jgi:predicted PurR-regulated permease PerM
MSPLQVFSAVLIGASLGGIVGGLIAIPVAGCIRVLLIDYLKTRKVIERSEKAEA